MKTPSGKIYKGLISVIDKTPVSYRNRSDLQLEEMLADTGKIYELDTVFLQEIIGGKYSLFELNDLRGKTHFFYSVENSKPEELKYSIRLEREHSTRFIMVQEQNEFINQRDIMMKGDFKIIVI